MIEGVKKLGLPPMLDHPETEVVMHVIDIKYCVP